MVARRISSSRLASEVLSILSTMPHVVATCQVLEVGVGACGHGGARSAQFEGGMHLQVGVRLEVGRRVEWRW